MRWDRKPGPCTIGHARQTRLRPEKSPGRQAGTRSRPRSDWTPRAPETRLSRRSTTCRSPPARARTTRAPRPHRSRRLLRSQAAGGCGTRPPQGARADPLSLMLETARRAVTLHRKLCSQNCTFGAGCDRQSRQIDSAVLGGSPSPRHVKTPGNCSDDMRDHPARDDGSKISQRERGRRALLFVPSGCMVRGRYPALLSISRRGRADAVLESATGQLRAAAPRTSCQHQLALSACPRKQAGLRQEPSIGPKTRG